MSSFLSNIILYKQKEVEKNKDIYSMSLLEKSLYFKRSTYSLKTKLEKESVSIITEFKRKSPSKGMINNQSLVEVVIKEYEEAGAAAVSILTDTDYFGGSVEDIKKVRDNIHIPILRKEFIVDEYQIIEAKSIGADVILLIATCLSKQQIKTFVKIAKDVGLEVIFEVHHANEIDSYVDGIDIIGVNNRNLQTFEVSIQTSMDLFSYLPSSIPAIAESGMHQPNQVIDLSAKGYKGFLIGEVFMKSATSLSCKDFINTCKKGKIINLN